MSILTLILAVSLIPTSYSLNNGLGLTPQMGMSNLLTVCAPIDCSFFCVIKDGIVGIIMHVT